MHQLSESLAEKKRDTHDGVLDAYRREDVLELAVGHGSNEQRGNERRGASEREAGKGKHETDRMS